MGRADKREMAESMTEPRYLAPTTLTKRSAHLRKPAALRVSWPAAPICWCRCVPAWPTRRDRRHEENPEMMSIEQTADGGFRIGAAVSGMALREHKNFGRSGPACSRRST